MYLDATPSILKACATLVVLDKYRYDKENGGNSAKPLHSHP